MGSTQPPNRSQAHQVWLQQSSPGHIGTQQSSRATTSPMNLDAVFSLLITNSQLRVTGTVAVLEHCTELECSQLMCRGGDKTESKQVQALNVNCNARVKKAKTVPDLAAAIAEV